MTNRRTLLKSATALVALSLAGPVAAHDDAPIKVVATFSILGNMVERIGGDHIDLTTLVGPDGDAHVYQPTPADARAVSGAEVLFINGLEFEGWIERLSEAADFDGHRVVATTGIDEIAFEAAGNHDEAHDDSHDHDDAHDDDHDHDDHGHDKDHDHKHEDHKHEDHDHEDHAEAGHDHGHDHHHAHGAVDPHAWQSLPNAVIYVDNITAALAQADPDNAGAFYANRAEYVAEIEALHAEITEIVAALPEDRRTVVTSHDAFGYFAAEYGLTFLAPQGMSTESEASARDVAGMITQIREQSISAVFVENISDGRLLEQIVSETDASIGGTLYSDALSGPDGPAPTYLDMMRHNAGLLADALNS